MKSSDKLDQLAASLYAFQRLMKMPTADQDADAGSYSFPYLSLPALIEFITKKLDEVSLSYAQEVTRADDGANITTRIMHSTGQWLELGPLFLPVKGNAQAWGSAISYGRRYALAAAFGIQARGEDDDAASAGSSPTQEPTVLSTQERSGRDGAAEIGEEGDDVGEGAAPSSPPSKPDKQRWMEEFHPGKPHKMRPAPVETKPPVLICRQDTVGKADCPYTEDAKP